MPHDVANHAGDNGNNQKRAGGDHKEAKNGGYPKVPGCWPSLAGQVLQFPGGDQLRILPWALVLHFIHGDGTDKNHRIQGKFFRAQVGVVKMDGEDKTGGEQRLVAVDDGGNVEPVAGEKYGGLLWKPEGEAGGADDRDTPENSHEIEFFPVGPAAVL